jgi:hypothetical protein
MTREELETALDRGQLQVCADGRGKWYGKWYDIRRNGQTKTWKREPGKVEIPCKVGFREAFRLRGDHFNNPEPHWLWNYAVRVRPDNFDPRKRD